ncbi:MAG: hypothetical protein NC086_10615, partial [Alistipes sp.]|nr:hypothetical protein [Alistipes sp.]
MKLNILKNNYFKMLTAAWILSICLSGCGYDKNVSKQPLIDAQQESGETQSSTDMSIVKVEDYTDLTASLRDIFQIEDQNEIFASPAAVYDFSDDFKYNFGELYQDVNVKNIVVGEVLDIAYYDLGEFPRTYYSFAVSDVLKGDDVSRHSIITVAETKGYRRLSRADEIYGQYGFTKYGDYSEEEREKKYEIFAFYVDEPQVNIGDRYVICLSGKNSEAEYVEEGCYYYLINDYMGKYYENENGMYERFIPEAIRIINADMYED